MTAAENEQLQQIERDRRRREALLLLILLGFSERALAHARAAVRVGADPVQSASDVIAGNPSLHLRGLQAGLVDLLKEVYFAGVWRAGITVGVMLDVDRTAPVPPHVAAAASELAIRTADAVRRIASIALAQARTDGLRTSQVVTTLGAAWRAAGMHRDNPYALEAAAERAVVTGFGAGMWDGWHAPEVVDVVVGFTHRTILDGRETEICHERAGYQRPRDDAYWLENWPSLHWGCRSIILPERKVPKGGWSTGYPINSAEPGFGRAPATAFGVRVGRAA